MFSGCLTIDCLRSFCLVKSRDFAHLAALGLVSMMLHYVIVKTVVLVGLMGMHKTGCSGATRLVLHVPSSSWAGKRFNYYYYYYYYIFPSMYCIILCACLWIHIKCFDVSQLNSRFLWGWFTAVGAKMIEKHATCLVSLVRSGFFETAGEGMCPDTSA